MRSSSLRVAALCAALSTASLAAQPAPPPITTRSPDGRLALTVRGGAEATYEVSVGGVRVVQPSALGFAFASAPPFGPDVRLELVTRAVRDDTVRGLVGKTSSARDHHRETVIAMIERQAPHRRVELVVRAYDDGVAFRYRVPAQPALDQIAIAGERTQVVTDPASRAWVLPRSGFVSSYEGFYRVGPLGSVPADTLLALPVLLHHPAGSWISVTEAALTDYAGTYLVRTRAGRLASRLSPRPGEPGVAVRAQAPFATPWRVFMIAADPVRLVASNLVTVLNPPSAIADASWIRPGKTTFPWWNDYVLPDTTFTAGLNTETMKYYVDFCAAHGIPYHTLDGYQDLAWYGGHIEPRDSVMPDVTRGRPGLDLPEVLSYARSKGVRIRAWMHWRALRPQLDSALARYERMGIEGIMVDFMDRDDQEMLALQQEIVAKAAAHHLTVVFHGVAKPTGLARTWPNLLTYEAVMGLEYDKFEDHPGLTPAHELVVPFTRMLAGPIDFHQGGFRHVPEAGFRPRYTGPRVIGTRARALAMYVVYEDPLPMVADAPSVYAGQPGFDFVARTPTVWDETRALGGAIGEWLTVARRSGAAWWVGTMTDGHARTVRVPLGFLGRGRWEAEIWTDDVARVPGARVERRVVTARDTLVARLAPAGGLAVRLAPVSDSSR